LKKGDSLSSQRTVIGIIPARFGSTRLPGKPLIPIAGKPLIQWVWEGARKSSVLSKLLVATDDEKIFQAVMDFGGEAVMTPENLPSGTDRAAYVMQSMEADIVVNIQGDEPLIESQEIDQVASILLEDSKALMGTLIKKIKKKEELVSSNTAKVIVDASGYALYFSRNAIPFCRDCPDYEEWLQIHSYYKHVGIYSFRKSFLLQFSQWEPGVLEKIEKLEQLRVLEKGYTIKVAETEYDPICVDTYEDLEKVKRLIHVNQQS
jgi:3-deoxy-manno-octulosonate cytidylyltransferase (CMP-KDO synthetase)